MIEGQSYIQNHMRVLYDATEQLFLARNTSKDGVTRTSDSQGTCRTDCCRFLDDAQSVARLVDLRVSHFYCDTATYEPFWYLL